MHSARYSSSSRPPDGAAGFTLIEVLVSVALLSMVSLGVAQLFALSTRANMAAKGTTSTALLAVQKMEQLRSLTWGFDLSSSNLGLPATDTTTDLSLPMPAGGGSGLNPSPPDTLTSNVQGYVDYLDHQGTWLGNGGQPPTNTRFIRRWAITPLPTNPNNTLVFQVRVTTMTQAAEAEAAGGDSGTPSGLDTWLASLKTRKAQ
jgi:prepilin-type N-terminal cleavage/methylation domain-containing protein